MDLLTLSTEPQEEWRDVAGHPGYQVSNLGGLRTAWIAGGLGKGAKITGEAWKRCSPKPNTEGYCTTRLKPNAKTVSIHRMVAFAFLDKGSDKTEVNHKNGIKSDNRIENLEWVTRSENIKHAYDCLGKITPSQKLSNDDALDIRIVSAFGATQRGIAAAFNVTHGTIGAILRRESFLRV